MKALRIIFFSIFLLLSVFSSCFAFAENGVPYAVNCTWIIKDTDSVLCLSLVPEKGCYTYAPQQENVYPTQIFLQAERFLQTETLSEKKQQEIPCLFPLGTWKDDKGLGQKIRVFEGTVRIYLLFPKQQEEQYAGNIEISLLACSKERCQPVVVQKSVSSAPCIDIQSFQYKQELETLVSAYSQHVLAKEQIGAAKYRSKTERVAVSAERQENPAESLNESGEKSETNENGDVEAFSLTRLQAKAENNALQVQQENTQADTVYSFSVRPFYQGLEVQSLVKALFFGFIAGFILNFMPCVLPVIALKLHALVGGAGALSKEGEFSLHVLKSFREQMLFFALGILMWFIFLAFLFGGLGLTWGQLFQEYWLMLGLCVLVFVLALSLFDVFHLPIINLRVRKQKNIKLDALLSGFLATILATPCSGPLLGGVLGFVMTQSFWVIVLVFVCMGLGMAFPYFIFVVKPRWVLFMPKAGNWLLIMEKILAFFLLGTALYLFSLLPDFLHIKALVFLFVVCLCLYVWGKWASMALGKKQKWLACAGLCLIVLCYFSSLFLQSVQKDNISFWQEFQPQEFQQNLGQKTLLVKFTADWCPTCKVLEQTVFTEENMQALAKIAGAQEQAETAFILVDMTQYENEKQKLLTSLGSASIPFLAVFPQNNPSQPLIVRDIYTFTTVEQVLKKAVAEKRQ